jgi:hypothetical protein
VWSNTVGFLGVRVGLWNLDSEIGSEIDWTPGAVGGSGVSLLCASGRSVSPLRQPRAGFRETGEGARRHMS